jgi:hypothetical protein
VGLVDLPYANTLPPRPAGDELAARDDPPGTGTSAITPYEPPSGLIPSLSKFPHSPRAMSWYVFVALVLVVAIGAAILIAMWLEHRNPPPGG